MLSGMSSLRSVKNSLGRVEAVAVRFADERRSSIVHRALLVSLLLAATTVCRPIVCLPD